MAKSRRSYKGAAVANTVGTLLTSTGTTITLGSSMSGWPTGAEPFFCVIEPGTAREEKVCVKYASSNSLTVVDPAVTSSWPSSVNGRGVDDTSAFEHAVNSVIYPVLTAREMNDANELASTYTANGDLVVHGSTSFKKIAAGTNNYVLMADSSVTDGGVKWGQVVADSIATGAVTSAKILDGTIATGDLANDAVTAAKIADATLKLLCPVGTIVSYGGASAPTGWLLCNGDAIDGAYTELIALVGANTPDMKGRFPIGDDSTLTLLGSGGSLKISSANLPTHTHTIDHNHGSQTVSGGTHTHTYSGTVSSVGDHVHNWSVDGVQTYFGTDYYGFAGGGGSTFQTAGAGGHDHTFSGTTTTTGSGHDHTVDIDNFTGNSGNGGFANSDYYPPYRVVNFIIKHDY